LLDACAALLDQVREDFKAQAFHQALIHIWEVIGKANRYIDEQAPWALRKTDAARMNTVLYVGAETVRHLALLTQPVTPTASAAMLDQLGVAPEQRDFTAYSLALTPGTPLPKPKPIYPRLADDDAEEKGGAA